MRPRDQVSSTREALVTSCRQAGLDAPSSRLYVLAAPATITDHVKSSTPWFVEPVVVVVGEVSVNGISSRAQSSNHVARWILWEIVMSKYSEAWAA